MLSGVNLYLDYDKILIQDDLIPLCPPKEHKRLLKHFVTFKAFKQSQIPATPPLHPQHLEKEDFSGLFYRQFPLDQVRNAFVECNYSFIKKAYKHID